MGLLEWRLVHGLRLDGKEGRKEHLDPQLGVVNCKGRGSLVLEVLALACLLSVPLACLLSAPLCGEKRG